MLALQRGARREGRAERGPERLARPFRHAAPEALARGKHPRKGSEGRAVRGEPVTGRARWRNRRSTPGSVMPGEGGEAHASVRGAGRDEEGGHRGAAGLPGQRTLPDEGGWPAGSPQGPAERGRRPVSMGAAAPPPGQGGGNPALSNAHQAGAAALGRRGLFFLGGAPAATPAPRPADSTRLPPPAGGPPARTRASPAASAAVGPPRLGSPERVEPPPARPRPHHTPRTLARVQPSNPPAPGRPPPPRTSTSAPPQPLLNSVKRARRPWTGPAPYPDQNLGVWSVCSRSLSFPTPISPQYTPRARCMRL